MNQQPQKKTTPVTAKKRKATDKLSQPIGKKTTASNVNAIPGLVGASNALVSLKASKASTALNGTVLNETVLNKTESNATVSNGTVLNGSNVSLGISNTSATKKSLLSKEGKEGKAVTNKSDDYSNKRKRGETNKTPQPPIKNQATAESKAAKEAEQEENDVVVVEPVNEAQEEKSISSIQTNPKAPYRLPWFSSNGYYYEHEFEKQSLGIALVSVGNPNDSTSKELMKYPGRFISVTYSKVEAIEVGDILIDFPTMTHLPSAANMDFNGRRLYHNYITSVVTTISSCKRPLKLRFWRDANSKEREALRIAEAKVVEDTRIADEKLKAVNEARKLKEALEAEKVAQAQAVENKRKETSARVAEVARVAKAADEAFLIQVKDWDSKKWNNYRNLQKLNKSLNGKGLGRGNKTKKAIIESIKLHPIGKGLIDEYISKRGTFTLTCGIPYYSTSQDAAAAAAEAARVAKAAAKAARVAKAQNTMYAWYDAAAEKKRKRSVSNNDVSGSSSTYGCECGLHGHCRCTTRVQYDRTSSSSSSSDWKKLPETLKKTPETPITFSEQKIIQTQTQLFFASHLEEQKDSSTLKSVDLLEFVAATITEKNENNKDVNKYKAPRIKREILKLTYTKKSGGFFNAATISSIKHLFFPSATAKMNRDGIEFDHGKDIFKKEEDQAKHIIEEIKSKEIEHDKYLIEKLKEKKIPPESYKNLKDFQNKNLSQDSHKTPTSAKLIQRAPTVVGTFLEVNVRRYTKTFSKRELEKLLNWKNNMGRVDKLKWWTIWKTTRNENNRSESFIGIQPNRYTLNSENKIPTRSFSHKVSFFDTNGNYENHFTMSVYNTEDAVNIIHSVLQHRYGPIPSNQTSSSSTSSSFKSSENTTPNRVMLLTVVRPNYPYNPTWIETSTIISTPLTSHTETSEPQTEHASGCGGFQKSLNYVTCHQQLDLSAAINITDGVFRTANNPENLTKNVPKELNTPLSVLSNAFHCGKTFDDVVAAQRQIRTDSVPQRNSWGVCTSYLPLIAKRYPNTLRTLRIYKLNGFIETIKKFTILRDEALQGSAERLVFERMHDLYLALAFNTRRTV